MSRRALSAALIVVLVASLQLSAAVPAGSADRLPQLRLISAARNVTMQRWPGEPPALAVGTHLAAVGAPFEVRVKRTRDGLEATQVLPQRGGEVRPVRVLPDWAVTDLNEGLHAFFVVTAFDADGEQVMRRRAPLCFTGSYDQARVDDTGPQSPRYPAGCYTSHLARGAVWGLDRGWAVRAPQFVDAPNLPDGEYDVTVAIALRYVRLFSVPARYASTQVHLTLETMEVPPCDPDYEPCEQCGDGVPCEPCGPEEPCVYPPVLGGGSAGEEAQGVVALELGRAATAEVTADAAGLPDLVALRAHAIHVHVDEETGRDVITFGATVWNKGPGPLVVEGFRRPGRDLMDAYQYLYDGGRRVAKIDAGTLEFDRRDGHHHWHFTDFARYRLLDADRTLARRSRKEAFCLAPTDAIDLTLPTANWQPGSTGLQTACGGEESIWIREILDVGWGDTYHQSLPGQSFDVTRLPNGTYFIEVATNPVNNLRERTRANNTTYRKIRLGGSRGERTLELR